MLRVVRTLFYSFIAVLLASCSGASKERMLRFFFDEPPVVKKEVLATSPSQAKQDTARVVKGSISQMKYTVHSPYGEKQCGACHALNATKSFTGEEAREKMSGSSGRPHEKRLLKAPDEICLECHDDKSEEALSEEAEVVHGPVAAGECLECHYPHRSPYEFLLRSSDPVRKLCFTCHDEEDVLATGPHADLEGESCTECHNPHAGGEFLIK